LTLVGDDKTLGHLVRDAVLVTNSFRIRWTVPDFAKHRQELELIEFLRSPEFWFAGRRWRINVYPHGNPRYTTKYVSAYIVNVSLEEAARRGLEGRNYRCFFEIAALNRDDSLTSRKRFGGEPFSFGMWMNPGPFDRGFHFLLDHELLGADSGFLVDGALTVEVVIKPACRCKT
jgi:hypothetical protein